MQGSEVIGASVLLYEHSSTWTVTPFGCLSPAAIVKLWQFMSSRTLSPEAQEALANRPRVQAKVKVTRPEIKVVREKDGHIEGYLEKKAETFGKTKLRYFRLGKFCRLTLDSKAFGWAKDASEEYLGSVSVADMKSIQPNQKRAGFVIKTSDRELVLAAGSAAERDKWVKFLQLAREKKSQARRQEIGEIYAEIEAKAQPTPQAQPPAQPGPVLSDSGDSRPVSPSTSTSPGLAPAGTAMRDSARIRLGRERRGTADVLPRLGPLTSAAREDIVALLATLGLTAYLSLLVEHDLDSREQLVATDLRALTSIGLPRSVAVSMLAAVGATVPEESSRPPTAQATTTPTVWQPPVQVQQSQSQQLLPPEPGVPLISDMTLEAYYHPNPDADSLLLAPSVSIGSYLVRPGAQVISLVCVEKAAANSLLHHNILIEGATYRLDSRPGVEPVRSLSALLEEQLCLHEPCLNPENLAAIQALLGSRVLCRTGKAAN